MTMPCDEIKCSIETSPTAQKEHPLKGKGKGAYRVQRHRQKDGQFDELSTLHRFSPVLEALFPPECNRRAVLV